MRKKLLVLAIMMLGLFFLNLNVNQAEGQGVMQKELLVNEEDLTIWIVTDLHYLSPSLFDDGEAFAKMEATSAGKDLRHAHHHLEALVWQVANEEPDLLIVSGDLTFNGEYQSMLEIAESFKKLEANGTQVSVIPGNHDINSSWARKFEGEEMTKIAHVSPDQFKELFADYGYDLAVYSDPTSLSYIIEPKKGYPFIMLDTNIYSDLTQAPVAAGMINDTTFAWLDDFYQEATDIEKAFVVAHHPLLNGGRGEGNSLGLQHADVARDYFIEKGIKMSFAGHIHAQSISEANGFHEIVTGALSVYPNTIGVATLSNEVLSYEHESLDVQKWAQETEQIKTELLNYSRSGRDILKKDGEILGLGMMFEEQWFDVAYKEDVMDVMGKLNIRRFTGGDDKELIDLRQHPGYQIIQDNSKAFLKRYSNRILEGNDRNDLQITLPHSP